MADSFLQVDVKMNKASVKKRYLGEVFLYWAYRINLVRDHKGRHYSALEGRGSLELAIFMG